LADHELADCAGRGGANRHGLQFSESREVFEDRLAESAEQLEATEAFRLLGVGV